MAEGTDKKKKVLLHYYELGVQRSPNDQFDLLANQKMIRDNYELGILNQEYTPSKIGNIKSIKILKEQIEKEKPDIIHISGVKEGFHCVVAAYLAGCKKRILITHGFEGYSSSNRPLKRFVFRWLIEPITIMFSTDVQCNSLFSYNTQMIRLFAAKKSVVIYNFLKTIEVESPRWRQSRNIKPDDIVITTIGNMHIGKGYDIVSKAIYHYQEKFNVKFAIIGDGPLKEEFEKVNQEYINANKVYVLGKIPHKDAMQILSESDIFFLPSRFETLGMVFAEAGYLGIPSVAAKVGAVEEVVLDKKTGFLVEKDDELACMEALDKLICSKELRSELGSNAQNYIKKIFSQTETAKKVIELYRR